MREALDAIHNGMSVSKASVTYGIPRTTPNDHKLGKVKPGVKAGPVLHRCCPQQKRTIWSNFYSLLLMLAMGVPGTKY